MKAFFSEALDFNEYLNIRTTSEMQMRLTPWMVYFSPRFSALYLKTVKIRFSSFYLLRTLNFFKGFNIRAVILMNPHNPLAEIYTLKEMIAFLEFAKRYVCTAITPPALQSCCSWKHFVKPLHTLPTVISFFVQHTHTFQELCSVCVISSVCHIVLSPLLTTSILPESLLHHLLLSE